MGTVQETRTQLSRFKVSVSPIGGTLFIFRAYNGRMTETKLMTLNLMTDTMFPYGKTSFACRAASIEELIRWNDPDLVGVQELTSSMIPSLTWLEKHYTFVGKSRNRSLPIADERNYVLFKKDRYTLLKSETFWLSSRPEKEGSRLTGSIFPRIATLAILKDRETGAVFTFCNTHLDFMFPAVRTAQTAILKSELIGRFQGDYLLLTGDFNTTSMSDAARVLTGEGNVLNLMETVTEKDGSTLRDPIGSMAHDQKPIDHILISKDLHVDRVTVLRSMYMGVYPTDHFPVMVSFHQ